MKFNSKFHFKPEQHRGEDLSEGSLTIQGDAYSIKELLEKYANGVMPAIGKTGDFEEEPDIDSPDPTRAPDFDLSDLDRLGRETKETLDKRDFIETTRAEKAQKEATLKEARKLLELESEAKETELKKGLEE